MSYYIYKIIIDLISPISDTWDSIHSVFINEIFWTAVAAIGSISVTVMLYCQNRKLAKTQIIQQKEMDKQNQSMQKELAQVQQGLQIQGIKATIFPHVLVYYRNLEKISQCVREIVKKKPENNLSEELSWVAYNKRLQEIMTKYIGQDLSTEYIFQFTEMEMVLPNNDYKLIANMQINMININQHIIYGHISIKLQNHDWKQEIININKELIYLKENAILLKKLIKKEFGMTEPINS